MKKILSALAAVVFFALVLGAGAALAADTGSNELFRYDPDTGRIVGSFESEAVSVEIYLDRSLVEAFFEESKAISIRAYPEDRDSRAISLFADGDVTIVSIYVATMTSIFD